ncbi:MULTISPECIES: hypothetical protein [Erwinia]|uniref:Uncharacterized protein n=2 Tax=Erwinia TaxID=551 RepID=A0A014M7N2_9GAMM|nr:hypothetical protein [Erwinia mallotivora]EXU74109.1 hypothetical protein BG55_18990 [Erwinia mallotivora]
MKKISALLTLLACGFSGISWAGEAHVCHSPAVATNSAAAMLSDNTVFNCGEKISGTLPQLAAQGWIIVQQTDQVAITDPSRVYAQLIIRK